jgi:hypothetical protein
MSAAPEPGALFDASEFAPKRKAREVPPAYRLGRANAQRFRDEELARLRSHQRECSQCWNAWDVAQAKGTKAYQQTCTDGYLIYWRFAQLNFGLLRGYYPDHGRREATRVPRDHGQVVLF